MVIFWILESERLNKTYHLFLGGRGRGLCHVACGIVVLQPNIEPRPLAVKAQS